MSLGYASFSDSAAQELLPMHEKYDQSAFEYKLHEPQIDQKHSCSNFDELKERFSGIQPQDEISKKKATIHKWQVLTMVLALTAVFLGFWGYNARNRVVTMEVKNVSTLHLPRLTLCIPGGQLLTTPHALIFKQYNLTNVREPGDFIPSRDITTYCVSDGFDNTCKDFIEYNGTCIHIGLNNNTFPWSLKTVGRTVLSFMFVYQHLPFTNVRNLVLPFFGWTTNCTVGRDGNVTNVEDCTKQKYIIFEERTENPLVLYQVIPNQLTLAEIHKEVHVNAQGIRTELYPTTFVTFPFTSEDDSFFNNICAGIPGGCDVIFFGIRSLSQTVQTTYEERYLLSIIRSFGTAASLIALISAVCTFIYAFFVTKLIFREKQAHLDHDLRDAIMYLHKELSVRDKAVAK